jgi:hypothetical protein
MAYVVTSSEWVDVGGVPLATPAWTLENLQDLWSGPVTRGTDLVIPEARGQRPYPRRIDAWRLTLNVAVYGDLAWDGTAHSDPRAGLWANIAHLRANAFDPPGTGDGTRPLVLHLPDGSTLDATTTVERFVVGSAINWFSLRATVDLVIPAGVLT